MNYYERYNNLITEARANPSQYPGETHHIIPRSIHKLTPSVTPVNSPENLIFLSHRQHLEAHWLLFKIYQGTVHAGNMATAFVLMISVGKTPAQPTAEQYEAYELARIAASERIKGRRNPNYGKVGKLNPNYKNMIGEKNPMFGKTGKAAPSYGRKPIESMKVTSKPVINTKTGEVWKSLTECARQLGVPNSTVQMRIQRKSLGGIWQYVENHNTKEVI